MKYSFKFLVVAGFAISMLNSCGVKYIEKGFGGGCGEHHTAKLNHSQGYNHKTVNQLNSLDIKENEVSDSKILFTNETELNVNVPEQKLTLVQKLKLIQNVKQHIKNIPKSKSSDLGKQEIKSSQSVKIKKNDFDTSEMGIVKLILVILLALLILGLVNQLLGMPLINLLVLLLLIYFIWMYLF